ncbi:formate hydrogenlyase subunit 3 [Salmonella enterica subsp. arizonae]|uniref:Formate hydrogenlyase subunit 3 n=1 Tax=Salmonella enterica subsp. arizonae TaxID=59203 RepID=A0A2X4T2C4_SALER|nr:formate hydrogenlyase subunit 3 [Salmonella enterica subsp. arizonae]
MPFTGQMLQITPLNAIWLITLGLCGLFVSLFNIDWHRHPQVKANGLLVNLLIAAAVCAVVASNLGDNGGDGGNYGALRSVPYRR